MLTWATTLIPAEDKKIIHDLVNRAFVGGHVVQLVDNREHWDEVLAWVGLPHDGDHIGPVNPLLTEALLVEGELLIVVHASLQAEQGVVDDIEVELHLSLIHDIWDVFPLVVVVILLLEVLPEFS